MQLFLSNRHLLDDLAHQAGVAAHAVLLTAELQHWRERRITTREEERRRLRRDLHDRLGPTLAALNLQAGVLWLHDEPVALTSLFLHAGVAGIYGVTTIPEARRQGIAAAMTQSALHEARLLGYRVAILSPTQMSRGIYRRLGFQEYSTIHHSGWPLAQ